MFDDDEQKESGMIVQKIVLNVMLTIPIAAPALAQSSSSEVRRDIDQEMRIERGLKSGQLTTGEAA